MDLEFIERKLVVLSVAQIDAVTEVRGRWFGVGVVVTVGEMLREPKGEATTIGSCGGSRRRGGRRNRL
jgi:hypothetical protein